MPPSSQECSRATPHTSLQRHPSAITQRGQEEPQNGPAQPLVTSHHIKENGRVEWLNSRIPMQPLHPCQLSYICRLRYPPPAGRATKQEKKKPFRRHRGLEDRLGGRLLQLLIRRSNVRVAGSRPKASMLASQPSDPMHVDRKERENFARICTRG